MANVPTTASPHPEVLFASVTLATTSPALAIPKKAAIAGQGENHPNCCTQFTATLMV